MFWCSALCDRVFGTLLPPGDKFSEWVWEGHQEKVAGNDNLCLSSPSDGLVTLKLWFPKVVRCKVQNWAMEII